MLNLIRGILNLDDIGIFRLANNYSHFLNISGINQKGSLYSFESIHGGNTITAGVEKVNWQELKDFLKKMTFIGMRHTKLILSILI